MVQTLRRSHTRCTSGRRQISPDFSSGLYFTVRRLTCSSIRANFVCSVLGIVVVLFFQCMTALLNPVNRAWGGIKWPLVAHTAAMFSFATIYTAMNLNLQSIAYIDNREFPGEKMVLPGPLGYQFLIYSKAISVVPNLMYMLNNWLADGLLVSFVSNSVAQVSNVGRPSSSTVATLSMLGTAGSLPSHASCISLLWVRTRVLRKLTVAFWANVVNSVMGIMVVYYQASQPDTSSWSSIALNFNYPYFSIALSLNLLLTLMVVARLAIHSKNVRNVTGQPAGAIRLCITILIESCALYAASFMLFIGPWGAQSRVAQIFYPMLSETQVRAVSAFS